MQPHTAMDLRNANIIVTGGSSGIGKQTAKLLKACGANVLITGRDADKVTKVAAEIGCLGLAADVSKDADIMATFEYADTHLPGKLDALINNAGIGIFGELETMNRQHFDEIFNVNVYGAAMMMKQAIRRFKQNDTAGSIINIASTSALKGFKGGSVYAASKFALRGLTQCVADEVRRYNIRVCLICPSEVTTAFGNAERAERTEIENKLRPADIAKTIKDLLEFDNRAFIPELSVWATNPF